MRRSAVASVAMTKRAPRRSHEIGVGALARSLAREQGFDIDAEGVIPKQPPDGREQGRLAVAPGPMEHEEALVPKRAGQGVADGPLQEPEHRCVVAQDPGEEALERRTCRHGVVRDRCELRQQVRHPGRPTVLASQVDRPALGVQQPRIGVELLGREHQRLIDGGQREHRLHPAPLIGALRLLDALPALGGGLPEGGGRVQAAHGELRAPERLARVVPLPALRVPKEPALPRRHVARVQAVIADELLGEHNVAGEHLGVEVLRGDPRGDPGLGRRHGALISRISVGRTSSSSYSARRRTRAGSITVW
jgi:hypothetical protein